MHAAATPPLTQPVAGQMVDLGCNVWDGTKMFEGYLYGISTPSAGSSLLLRWSNPYDLTRFTSVSFPADLSLTGICGDHVNHCMYVGTLIHGTGGSPPHKAATIWRFDIDSLTQSKVVNAVDLGINPLIFGNSEIATDSTYIYCLMNTSGGQDGYLYKFRISDGGIAASLSFSGAIPGCTTSNGTNIQLFNGNVICAGIGDTGGPWALTCPQSLSGITTAIPLTGMITIDDDWDLIGTDMWTTDEKQPRVYKIACDLSTFSFTTVTPSGVYAAEPGLDGGYFDGTYFWTSDKLGRIYAIDPATGNPAGVYDQILRTGNLSGSVAAAPGSDVVTNETYGVPGGFIVISFDRNGALISQAWFVPTTDRSTWPREASPSRGGRR